MKRIIVACGNGIATSQAVASKVLRVLKGRGIEAEVEAVDIKSLDHYLPGADAYISIVKSDEAYDIPTFSGIPFLTGVGMDAETDKIVAMLEG